MKIFLVVLALCLSVTAGLAPTYAETHGHTVSSFEKLRQEEQAQKDACLAETGANMAVLSNAVDTKKWEAFDEKGKCFMACVMKKNNMVDEQGKLRLSELRTLLIRDRTPAQVEEIMAKCGVLKSSERCGTEFLFMKCLLGDFKPGVMRVEQFE